MPVGWFFRGISKALMLAICPMAINYEALCEAQKSQNCFKEALSIAEKYPDIPFAQQIISGANEKINK